MTENSPLGRLLADALQGSTPYGAGLLARPIASQGLAGLLGMQSFAQRMAAMPQPAPADTARGMLSADFGRGITADDPRVDLAMALATATPRVLADRIARYGERMGYSIDRGASNLSSSNYLTARRFSPDGTEIGDPFRIRISNHELPPSYGRGGDFEVRLPNATNTGHTHGDWADAVARLAEMAGVRPPPAVTRLLNQRKPELATQAAEQASLRTAAQSTAQRVASALRSDPEALLAARRFVATQNMDDLYTVSTRLANSAGRFNESVLPDALAMIGQP